MEGEAWGRACAGITSFWGGISIREVKSGPFFRTPHRVCSKSGVTDHTVDTQENTECQSGKGTYSVHSSPLVVHTGILRPVEGANWSWSLSWDPTVLGPLSLRLPIAGL